jgi:hypothetical protein
VNLPFRNDKTVEHFDLVSPMPVQLIMKNFLILLL